MHNMPHTIESKMKISQSRKGKGLGFGCQAKNPFGGKVWNKGLKTGKTHPQCGIQKGTIPPNKGKHFVHSGSFKAGELHRNFNNWSSVKPYSIEWTKKFKEKIRIRDKYTCRICDKVNSKHVHHIDYNKDNCDPNNLVTLCASCHMKTNFNRDYWKGVFSEVV